MPERDLSLVAAWLQQPHVARWWGNPMESERAVREHRSVDSALICLDGLPVGYLCWQVPTRQDMEAVQLADLPGDMVDIDIFIGPLSATGRGVGSEALNRLCQRLRQEGVRLVGMAASPDNPAACRAYEKAGFRLFRPFCHAGQNWHYLTRTLEAAA